MPAKYWSTQIVHQGQRVWAVRGLPEYVYEGSVLPLTKPGTNFRFQVRVVEIVGTAGDHVIGRTVHCRVWGESSRPVSRETELPAPVRRQVPGEDALW